LKKTRYEYESQWNFLRLFGGVLEKVSDIRDCVFIAVSFDYPLFTPSFPLASFTHGPRLTSPEIPYPWSLLFNDEVVYHQLRYHGKYSGQDVHTDISKKNFSPSGPHESVLSLSPHNDSQWAQREAKAAHFGTLWFTNHGISRQVVLDLAQKYPDFIDSKWTKALGPSAYKPRLNGDPDQHDGGHYENDIASSRLKDSVPLEEYMRKYKYLVVLAGQSTSGRLATFFSHSGAVVLMQETDLVYHFSARLRPWVHFVPLSYSGADLIDKIKWLRANDDLARQIAKNGYAFGQSFLRLEDYYCYAAAALEAVGEVVDSSALVVDKPLLLPPSQIT